MSTLRRWRRALVGLAIAVLFLALLGRGVDWSDVRQVLAGAEWPLLLLGLLALTADMAARITRWWLMLRAADPNLRLATCIRPFLGSLALNNTVPLRAGDVVRVFGFRSALRAPTAHVVGTLVLERMLDLLVLLAILFGTVLGTSGVLPTSFVMVAGIAGAVAVTALLAITLVPATITSVIQRVVGRLFSSRSWLPRASQAVAQLTASLALLRSPGRALRLLGLSLLAWILEGAVFACAASSLHMEVDWAAPWLSLAAATLATLLPSSPGYVGTFDYFAALGFSAYGASAAQGTAVALLTHLLLWLPVTSAGFIALIVGRSTRHPAELRPDSLRADLVEG